MQPSSNKRKTRKDREDEEELETIEKEKNFIKIVIK